MIRKIIIVIALIAFAVMAIIGLVSLSPKPKKKEESEVTPEVVAVEIHRDDVELMVKSQGEVIAKQEIAVVAQVSGKITSLSPSFAAGGKFDRGDMLVRIEQSDYRVAVIRAEASVAQAKQKLAFEQAQADLALREWQALGKGEASALTLRQPQLAESKALYDAAVAELRSVELNLSRTIIRAPFSGRVRSRNVGIGQFVDVGSSLGQIFSTEVVEVRLPLSDVELAELGLPLAYVAPAGDKGLPVTLSANVSGKQVSWTAYIKRTDAAIDAKTRRLFAIAEYEDPYGKGAQKGAPLAVGLYVKAELPGRNLEQVWKVPREADRGDGLLPVVDAEGKLAYRDVEIDTKDDDWLYVTDGVENGDQIVLSDLLGIRSGAKVKVVRPFRLGG